MRQKIDSYFRCFPFEEEEEKKDYLSSFCFGKLAVVGLGCFNLQYNNLVYSTRPQMDNESQFEQYNIQIIAW